MVKNRFKIGISLAVAILLFGGCSNQPDTKAMEKERKLEKLTQERIEKVKRLEKQRKLEKEKRLKKQKIIDNIEKDFRNKISKERIEKVKRLEKQRKLEKEKRLKKQKIIDNIEKDFRNKISKLYTDKYKYNNKDIRFSDNIQSWIDVDTSLIWEVKNKQNIKDKYRWEDAKRYCSNLVLDGYSDWRLPNIDELKTLLTKKKYNYYYIKKPLSANTKSYYWSATTYVNYTGNAWYVRFNGGYDRNYNKADSNSVRCVRLGGQ